MKKKAPFLGKAALEAQLASGLDRQLICFKMTGKGIPRQGYELQKNGTILGTVASGTFSPTLEVGIGTAHVRAGSLAVGDAFDVLIRKRTVAAEVITGPFYQRS
jgi:aminomethyltransferase